MAFFLKYVELYLTSQWGRFYVRHSVLTYIRRYKDVYHTDFYSVSNNCLG
jgi:hypothetical protein